MGDGDASRPEVAGLRGLYSPLCDFWLLCCVDGFYPADYGGTLSFSACTSSALVRMKGRRVKCA